MKGLICVLVLALNYISFSQSYPHLFELRGLEDSLGNTHLFYRYVYPSTHCWSKNIHHYDLSTNIDTLFIRDFGYEVYQGWGCEGDYIFDYEFFDHNPAKYIYGGYNLWIDPVALLRRYDGDIQLEAFALTEIEISKLDEHLVYVSAGQRFFKSTDGEYNFDFLDSIQFIDNSMISLNKNNDSQIYGIDDNKLVRSEDEGHSYIIVDDSEWRETADLFYDPDGTHIYGVTNFLGEGSLLISPTNGDPFTWDLKISKPGLVTFTLDEQNSGEVYYSNRKDIYKSEDYGITFSLFKQLDQKVTGLYKKSGSDILYASTPLKIYEITPDTIQTIKSLPIPANVFKWYPLNVGDKWIYHNSLYDDVKDFIRWISICEVVAHKIINNQGYQEILVKEIPIDSSLNFGTHYEYFRVDSANGKVYRDWFENDTLQFEEYFMDLLAEVGDTIPDEIGSNGLYLESEEPVTIFGLNSRKRTFKDNDPVQQMELVNKLGMTYQHIWGFVGYKDILAGCIIDGVVYGDTTVVSVDDEEPKVASSFMLEQNYPNPFNPVTKIQYTIPTSPLNPSPYQGEGQRERLITLKVYDVLGKEITTLVNEEKPAGTYEVEFNGNGLPSGIYFYRLAAGNYSATRKMIYLK